MLMIMAIITEDKRNKKIMLILVEIDHYDDDDDDDHLAPVLGTDNEDALSGRVFPCSPCSTNHLLILTPVEKLCTYVWITQYYPAKQKKQKEK